MLSEKFEYSWNRLFRSVEYDIYDIISDFGCDIYCADPLSCDIELYINHEDLPDFYEIINEKYHTNIPLYSNLLLWEIETEIVKADLLRFFSDKSFASSLNYNLFKFLFENPEEEVKEHFLNVIKNGEFSYLMGGIQKGDNSESISVIQLEQQPDELTSTLIIKGSKIGGDYVIIDFFPAMSILKSKQKPIKGMIDYCSRNLGSLGINDTNIDFWNFFEPLQFYEFSEGMTSEYIFWGLALDTKEILNPSDYNFSAAGINCLKKMKLQFSEFEENVYLGKQFLKIWISQGSLKIPVFVPKRLLSEKETNNKELEVQVLICGQIQPYVDDLSIISIKMEPDAQNLFWNEEGESIGNAESLLVNEHYDIKLNIEGLQEWLSEYENQCLIPCESGTITLEELNKTFDWESFHKRGLAFAAQVKRYLPICVELIYYSPFEDRSGIIDSDGVLIK